MKPSPLTILNHHPGKIRLVPTSEGEKTADSISVSTKTTCARHADDARRYRVELLVGFGKTKKDKTPERYRGEVEMIGYFKVHDTYPDEHIEQLIDITAVSVLYGAARELICNLTARHPHGCLSIPSVSFIDGAGQSKKKTAKN